MRRAEFVFDWLKFVPKNSALTPERCARAGVVSFSPFARLIKSMDERQTFSRLPFFVFYFDSSRPSCVPREQNRPVIARAI